MKKKFILSVFLFLFIFFNSTNENVNALMGSPPGTVTGFSVASQTATSVTLRWNQTLSATSYHLTKADPNMVNTTVTITPGTTTSYTFSNLTLGGTYGFDIDAANSYGDGADTFISVTVTGAASTPAPTNVHIVSQDSTDVSLGWDTMTGATSYQVTRNGTTVYTGTATSFADSGLSPNTAYTYNVYTIDSNGTSPASTINATTNPGSLSISYSTPSINFGTIPIDGTIHSIPVSMGTIEVSDTTGTNSGWNVTMSATPFTSSTDSSIKLPTNSFKLNGISQINRVSGSTNMPVSLVSSPLSIDNGTVKIVQAASGNGAGVYDIVFPANTFTLAVDTSKKLITSSTTQTVFHSTLTITVNVGP